MAEQKKARIDPALILLSGVSVLSFLLFYFSDFLRPGGAYKLGWYETWADQGAYMDMINGIRQGTLGHFNYPILYPLLGFLGSFFTKNDPLVLVNLLCFVSVIVLSFKVFEKYFSREASLVTALMLQNFLTGMFTMPWTTSLTTLFLAYVFYAFACKKFDLVHYILAGSCAGFAFATRIGDFLPVGAAAAVYFLSGFMKERKLAPVIWGLVSCAVIIAADLAVNYAFSGNLLGNYLANVGKAGFNVEAIPYKFYGYFIDPLKFHNENHPFSIPLLRHAFLFVLAPLGIYFLLREKKMRPEFYFAGAVLAGWAVIYLPFVAVTGFTLRNLSLHYSKMLFPILAFLSIYAIKRALESGKAKPVIIYFSALVLITGIFLHEFKFEQVNIRGRAELLEGQERKPWDGWKSSETQKPGMECVVELEKQKTINRVIIESRGKGETYPAEIAVYTRGAGSEWKRIQIIGFSSKGEVYDIIFEAMSVKAVKFVIEKENPGRLWAINNIYVFSGKH